LELAASHGRLLARPAPSLAGLIEVRGLGIRRLDHEAAAVVGLVVDLAVSEAERLPGTAAQHVEVVGILLPRLAIALGEDPLPAVLARLLTAHAEV
jgi:HPr kinase/phosphorylase